MQRHHLPLVMNRLSVISRCNVISRCRAQKSIESKPIDSGSYYPAGSFCSNCGLCDTPLIQHVKEACAFLGDGMTRISDMEKRVHGRMRNNDDDDELHFGVLQEMLYARNKPSIKGAQWTGIITKIAISMLESGAVDAVVCVQVSVLKKKYYC